MNVEKSINRCDQVLVEFGAIPDKGKGAESPPPPPVDRTFY